MKEKFVIRDSFGFVFFLVFVSQSDPEEAEADANRGRQTFDFISCENTPKRRVEEADEDVRSVVSILV